MVEASLGQGNEEGEEEASLGRMRANASRIPWSTPDCGIGSRSQALTRSRTEGRSALDRMAARRRRAMGRRWENAKPTSAGQWALLVVGALVVLAAVAVSLVGLVRFVQQFTG